MTPRSLRSALPALLLSVLLAGGCAPGRPAGPSAAPGPEAPAATNVPAPPERPEKKAASIHPPEGKGPSVTERTKIPRAADEASERGEKAYRVENYEAAERHFRQALRLAPGYLYALTGLAWTLYDARRPDEALPYFQEAHRRFPEDGSARRGLAYLLYRYGRRAEAKALLGSLDPERWPELANIDDELRVRALRGLPRPKAPPSLIVKKAPAPPEEAQAPRPETPEAPEVPKEKKAPETKEAPPAEAKLPSSGPAPWGPPDGQEPSLRNMVFIPGGSFVMLPTGGNPGEQVRVAPFRMDKFEVTNAQYAAFVHATGAPEPPFWRRPHFSAPHLPVVGVTWHEARAFCGWAGKRLPTDAEWEFAARGGGADRPYPWGSDFEDRNAVFGLSPESGGPKAVGRRPSGASLHGVEDLAGNVWEWVEDPYRRPGGQAPVVRNGAVYRTLRGGSWINSKNAMRAGARTGDLPGRRLPVYGFRCAADAP